MGGHGVSLSGEAKISGVGVLKGFRLLGREREEAA